jgi:pyruvate/2-oxoglutarate dehydrogenase complex dihydrolipoamide acyltransferase (E2) component
VGTRLGSSPASPLTHITHIHAQAASLALLQYPILNASLSEDGAEVIYHPEHNIGVAMDTPKGLVVPVLKRVQEKSLFQVSPLLHQRSSIVALLCCCCAAVPNNSLIK